VTAKGDFNADEWATVVEAPVLAGLRVVGADRGGTIRESVAIGKVYSKARQGQGQNELLDELLASPPAVDPKRVQAQGDIATASGDRLGEALVILNEKRSAEDVEAYKKFVMDVAQAAAEAHKEGGFIGIGGKQISDNEKSALDELRAVLDR
jgi:hypothetical protein